MTREVAAVEVARLAVLSTSVADFRDARSLCGHGWIGPCRGRPPICCTTAVVVCASNRAGVFAQIAYDDDAREARWADEGPSC